MCLYILDRSDSNRVPVGWKLTPTKMNWPGYDSLAGYAIAIYLDHLAGKIESEATEACDPVRRAGSCKCCREHDYR